MSRKDDQQQQPQQQQLKQLKPSRLRDAMLSALQPGCKITPQNFQVFIDGSGAGFGGRLSDWAENNFKITIHLAGAMLYLICGKYVFTIHEAIQWGEAEGRKDGVLEDEDVIPVLERVLTLAKSELSFDINGRPGASTVTDVHSLKTLLHYAVEQGNVAVVDCLIKLGASPHALSKAGRRYNEPLLELTITKMAYPLQQLPMQQSLEVLSELQTVKNRLAALPPESVHRRRVLEEQCNTLSWAMLALESRKKILHSLISAGADMTSFSSPGQCEQLLKTSIAAISALQERLKYYEAELGKLPSESVNRRNLFNAKISEKKLLIGFHEEIVGSILCAGAQSPLLTPERASELILKFAGRAVVPAMFTSSTGKFKQLSDVYKIKETVAQFLGGNPGVRLFDAKANKIARDELKKTQSSPAEETGQADQKKNDPST